MNIGAWIYIGTQHWKWDRLHEEIQKQLDTEKIREEFAIASDFINNSFPAAAKALRTLADLTAYVDDETGNFKLLTELSYLEATTTAVTQSWNKLF